MVVSADGKIIAKEYLPAQLYGPPIVSTESIITIISSTFVPGNVTVEFTRPASPNDDIHQDISNLSNNC
jgi:hypothetical protein